MFATVEQKDPSKPPVLTEGEFTPDIMQDFEEACTAYFESKDVDDAKRVRKILGGLRDTRLKSWISTDRPRLQALSFDAFMTELRSEYLDIDWEPKTRRELLSLKQINDTFRAFSARLKRKNHLLRNTGSYLDEAKLRHQLEANMSEDLAKRCTDKELDKVVDFRKWENAVKALDDRMRENDAKFQRLAREVREQTRRDNALTEPSRKFNKASSTASSSRAPAQSSKSSVRERCPALTDAERRLLMDNLGCLRCRKVFVDHQAKDCPNGFPDPSSYRPLTQAVVDALSRAREQKQRHSTGNAGNKRKIAALVVDDADYDSDEPAVHPVAAVLGHTAFPVAGMPSNENNVLSGSEDDESDNESGNASVSALLPLPPCPGRVPHRIDLPSDVSSHIAAVTPTDSQTAKYDSDEAPLRVRHLYWNCAAQGHSDAAAVEIKALIDHGAHTVLIRESLADQLRLPRRRLRSPECVELAMNGGQSTVFELTEYVTLILFDPSSRYTAKSVRAIIAPHLCVPVILGLPFLYRNSVVTDVRARTAIDTSCDFDLLNPRVSTPSKAPKKRLNDLHREVMAARTALSDQLNDVCERRRRHIDRRCERVSDPTPLAAVRTRIETLAASERLQRLGTQLVDEFKDVFEPLPHVKDLPSEVYCTIQLKDANRRIATRSYGTPRKYKQAWETLIQEHLAAGRIRPSNSAHASPAFLIPKADPTALPRWVNDYRTLNANTVLDSHPLPRVDDVLADCAKGKIWSKMDMTNSFFQTRMHPDDVHLTAVTTPLGLYEWLVMPMGLRNAPSIHQRRVTAALRQYIGKFCHIYLDDIVIWSQTIEDHARHLRLIMEALREARLYLNPKKCEFFKLAINFLGHRISADGIEPQSSKVDKILAWPQPHNATEVRSFLGLVRYVAAFLPRLAEHTRVLTPLTTKAATAEFPPWTNAHQSAFDAIKQLLVGRECLTVIDHDHPGDNRIFLTTDASDWRTGATLSWGKTWESARPVAFDSMQLRDAELNYPVHEKELLAIVRALKKWRSDLIGMPVTVYTDHRTLENFDTQKDLSRRQLRWQEYMAQYDLAITYIRGEDNTVADALSRVAARAFPGEEGFPMLAPVMSVSADTGFVRDILAGYNNDVFCARVIAAPASTPGARESNGLWYIGDRLLIPRTGTLREQLFKLAHDATGHFGTDKSYAHLRDAYYWPNMRRDLEQSYIPSCKDCQRNKGRTTRPHGPLHPLPVPEERGDSVAIDFIGPLPRDQGFDCIMTLTDRLGADVRIVPTHTNVTAEQMAVLFFDNWYCENGLPLEIISDRDKLFISKFWRALHKLSGVKLKMSSAFHPQTDGASERTNKTVNQCLRYHVRRNQRGWVAALPRVRFDIMNSVNASTGLSGFQLRMGRTPRIIPPLVPNTIPRPAPTTTAETTARALLDRIANDTAEARDNLLMAKVAQAHFANRHRGAEEVFTIDDTVMLTTFNRRREYRTKGDDRVAKFLPRFDGPYRVTKVHPETSSYTLELPNQPNTYPTFHASELKRHVPNDASMFPSREYDKPGPILTDEGLEEFLVEEIIDERKRGVGKQYLVRWAGYGPEDNRWLAGSQLQECAALDAWEASRAQDAIDQQQEG